MPEVSVVIPNYNGKKYIADCLRSLKKQSFTNFDIIVVDNGSDDGSRELVSSDFPDVRLIALPENTGFANAVNEGIRAAHGKFIFLLNNDAVCDENAIEVLHDVMERNHKIFASQARMLQIKPPHLIDDSGDLYSALGWAFSPGRDKKADLYKRQLRVTSACAGAAMYRKDMLNELGLFDSAHFCYLEDVDIGYRARLKGYINVMEPSAIVYHAGSGSSGSRYNRFKVELTAGNNLYLIYKNMPALQVIINLPLILLGIIIKHIFYMKRGLGRVHFKGLLSGLSRIIKNSDKKVKFGRTEYINAALLQPELWVNCVRRLLI